MNDNQSFNESTTITYVRQITTLYDCQPTVFTRNSHNSPFAYLIKRFFLLLFFSSNLPRSNIIGVLLVTVVYILTIISYLAVLTTDGLLSSDAVAVVSTSDLYHYLKHIYFLKQGPTARLRTAF